MGITSESLFAAFLLLGSTLVACQDECRDQKEAVSQLIEKPSNRACQTTDDCEVISKGCAEVKGSFCGQAQLNHSAADSAEWKAIEAAADECDDDCAVCDGALGASCVDGFCGGP